MPDDAGDECNDFLTNAWCGAPASSPKSAQYDAWGTTSIDVDLTKTFLDPQAVDKSKWRDPKVGWGLVLPESSAPPADKARAADAPECIRTLYEERCKIFAPYTVPVYRYVPKLEGKYLRHYALDGSSSDPLLGATRGVMPNAVPWYLLIVASPAEIPWQVQYRLQTRAYVGRLDLNAQGLENYVNALLADFSNSGVNRAKPVVWATDHGPDDITRLMRITIAERIANALANDGDHSFDMQFGTRYADDATHTALIDMLVERKPGFITTSSHGMTYPTDDSAVMLAHLGLPLDANSVALSIDALTSAWSPSGAIWYSHACCSAGCDSPSSFSGVADPTSMLATTLNALEMLSPHSAPLPQRLLGHVTPARAFVGHVEPTFDWSLRDKLNNQVTTEHVVQTFYDNLHLASRPPIGLALEPYQQSVGALWGDYVKSQDAYNKHKKGAESRMKRERLIASDRESMVLLGDPTVSLA